MSDLGYQKIELPKPRPMPTATSLPFWDALTEERVILQRCADCQAWVHYPRSNCPECLSDQLAWHDVSGEGVIFTFTVTRQATTPSFADEVPQIITIVELAEGVRFTTNLVNVAPEDVHVGMAVTPVFDHGDDGMTLLRYRPA